MIDTFSYCQHSNSLNQYPISSAKYCANKAAVGLSRILAVFTSQNEFENNSNSSRGFDALRRHTSGKATMKARQLYPGCRRIGWGVNVRPAVQYALTVLLLATCLSAKATIDRAQVYNINLPAQSVAEALTSLSEQTDVLVLFSYDVAEARKGNPVVGKFTLQGALDLLLQGTGLSGGLSDKGVLTISLQKSDTDNEGKDAMSNGKNIWTVMFGFLLGTSGAQVVTAQDQGDGGSRSYTIEEVIVSAQRRDQNVQDVGIAITQFSGDDMRELRMVRPEDLAAQTPGLDIKNGLGNFNPIFTIRGIGLNDYNVNNNPSVGAYLDEVYMPNGAYLAFSLYDMGRVEVLKGPQGTLFGRNTTAGAINFFTERPTEEFEAFIQMDYGRWNTLNLEGAISGSLSDTVRGRLAFDINSSDGYYKTNGNTVAGGEVGPSASTFDGQFGQTCTAQDCIPPNPVVESDSDFFEQENYAIRGSLEWDPSDTVSVFVTGHYSNDSSDNLVRSMAEDAVDRNGFSPTDDDPFTVDSNLDPEVDIDGYGGALTIAWELDTVTLHSVTGYETIDRMIPFDDSSPWRIVDQIFFDDAEFYSQELRLSSNSDGPFFWMVGGYYSNEDLTFQKDILGLDFVVRTTILTVFDQDAESYAAFAHTEYDLNEQWKLTVGARYTRDERSYSGGSFTEDPYGIDLAGVFFSAPQQSSGDFDEDYVDGKIALDWTPEEDVLYYASISLGHKGGGYDGSTITDPSSFIPFEAEEVLAYEIGMKSTLLDSTLQLNVSAFFYDYEDMQAESESEVLPGVFESIRANVGEAEIYGIDADLWWRPTEGLDIKVGAAYLDTELTSWNSTDPEEIDAHVGNEIPDAPEFTANGMIRYEWPVADALLASVMFDASYNASTFKDIGNTDYLEQPSYWLANARVAVGSEGGDWNVALYVKNMFDEEYIRQAFDNFGEAWVYETWGAPRTYGVTAIKHF